MSRSLCLGAALLSAMVGAANAQGSAPVPDGTAGPGTAGSQVTTVPVDRSNGVLIPKVDPDPLIQKGAPATASASTPMRVIPPPGTPGGDPTVVPK